MEGVVPLIQLHSSLSVNLDLADTAIRKLHSSLSVNLDLADTAIRKLHSSLSVNLDLADTAIRKLTKFKREEKFYFPSQLT